MMEGLVKIMIGEMIVSVINKAQEKIKEFEESNCRSPTMSEMERIYTDIEPDSSFLGRTL